MLGEQQLLDYLLTRRLISAKAVVSGQFRIVNASRRNRNFQVIAEDGPCYMIKQSDRDGTGLGTLSHEAETYRFLANAPTPSWFLPRLCEFNADQNLLLLELTKNAQDLRLLQIRRRSFSKLLARRIGQGLGELHSVPRNLAAGAFDVPYHPMGLSLVLPDWSSLVESSSANVELIRTIQRSQSLSDNLANLQAQWEPVSLIHGDFKWDNCIAYSALGSERRTRVRIVDWEFAGVGDPCWDLGAVFGDYLSTWILSIPATGEKTPEDWVEMAGFPLEKMQPAISTFWAAYVKQRGLPASGLHENLIKSVRYCASRLLQTCYEQTQQSITLNSHAYCHVQLAVNLLERPAEAAVHLLGLPIHLPCL